MLPGSYWEVARELGDKSYKVTLNSCLDTGHISRLHGWLRAGYVRATHLATYWLRTVHALAAQQLHARTS